MRWSIVALLDGFSDDGLQLPDATGERFNRALLLVQHLAQVIDDTLEVSIAGFEFRKSLVHEA